MHRRWTSPNCRRCEPPAPTKQTSRPKAARRLSYCTTSERRLPHDRYEVVAARGLGDVAGSREGEMVALDQHLVGRGAVEQPLAIISRHVAVHVEDRLPFRTAHEQPWMVGGVAQDQHGLVA